ncbi:MAG: bifunctional oligoribonuclease/PAP phosphatase NrnA [Sphingobacteriaceae bacterium]|nr:bifunctional oligoribonuclease/PAP phosphatase NrnA [Cytophagaceae bacterium]
MRTLEALQVLLQSPKRVVITTHHKPDADALGSSLGLAGYLQKKGHAVTVVTPSDYPKFLAWMPGNEAVVEFNARNRAQAEGLVAEAEVIFCLDFNALNRINDLAEPVRRATATKVMIDHHLEPEDFAEFQFSDPSAAATAQLVYQLIVELGDQALLDTAIGECLYAGFMTDTGSFRHPSTNPQVHRMAAELIELGVNTNRVHRLIFDNVSSDRLRFLGYVLSEKLVVLPEYRTAYIAVSGEELRRFRSQTGDTEGIVNYALSLENVVMAVLMIDRRPEAIKLSFRSVGDFSVNDLARKYFNGGGHRNASGGKTHLSLDETVALFLRVLPEFKDKLLAVK